MCELYGSYWHGCAACWVFRYSVAIVLAFAMVMP
jgi:hypothetical protein